MVCTSSTASQALIGQPVPPPLQQPALIGQSVPPPSHAHLLLVTCPHPYMVPAGIDQPAFPPPWHFPWVNLPCFSSACQIRQICLTWSWGVFLTFFPLGNQTVLKRRPFFTNRINIPFQWQLSKIPPFSHITIQYGLENVKAFICIQKWLFWPVLRIDFNEPVFIPLYQDFDVLKAMYYTMLENMKQIQAHLYCLYYTRGSLIS